MRRSRTEPWGVRGRNAFETVPGEALGCEGFSRVLAPPDLIGGRGRGRTVGELASAAPWGVGERIP